MKKVGIIGTGTVGDTLAAGFLKHGYEVMRGSRDPKKLDEWKGKAGDKAHTGDLAATAKFGDIVILAVAGSGAEEAVKLAGPDNLAGKPVLDTTNPIGGPPDSGVLGFFTDLKSSLMERLQDVAPKAHFVKCWSSVGSPSMVNPEFKGGRPSMFICGNDAAAKQTARGILDQFGWDTEDMGGAKAARAIEPLCMLWCIPGFLSNEWTHAFKVLHR